MALSNGPNLGILVDGAIGEVHYDALMQQWRAIDALVQSRVKSAVINTPPVSPADGDCYVVPSGSSGVWSTHTNKIARYSSKQTAWEYYTPKNGWVVHNEATSSFIKFNGTAWVDPISNKADLVDGKVPAIQLPSYVDDILEFPDLDSFPVTGESGKIYVAIDTGNGYRWSGSTYVKVSQPLEEIPQATIEAGTDSNLFALSARRVRQAIAAWWSGITNIDGKDIGATTAGTGRFTTLTTTGNVGIGVTPSAWGSSGNIEFQSGRTLSFAGVNAYLASNAYNNAGFKYKTNAVSALYAQESGVHKWYTAPSGTAGNAITFTERANIGLTEMVVNEPGVDYDFRVESDTNTHALFVEGSNGNVGIGTSSPVAKLHVAGNTVRFNDPSGNYLTGFSFDVTAGAGGSIIGQLNTAGYLEFAAGSAANINSTIRFRTANTERLRITSNGTVRPGADNTQSLGEASFRWSTVFAGTGTINTSDAREKTPVAEFTSAEVSAAKQLSKEIGMYQFLASVEAKGDAARKHVGLTVQRAIEIMEANGLDPFSYGFICYDEWDQQVIEHPAVEAMEAKDAWVETIEHEAELDEEGNTVVEAWTEAIEHPAIEAVEAKEAWTEVTVEAGNQYGFRYDQLNLFIARGIEARLAALEAA